MWNAPKNVISEREIRKEHVRVLESAIEDSKEFDIRDHKEVKEALEYLNDASYGVRRFRRGLEMGERMYLIEGLAMIKAYI